MLDLVDGQVVGDRAVADRECRARRHRSRGSRIARDEPLDEEEDEDEEEDDKPASEADRSRSREYTTSKAKKVVLPVFDEGGAELLPIRTE